ncbi:butyrophilin subfamily 1 member A1 isoform X2 [Haplochromis burtoni]|uniref:butyrophilin subfamily 1 member A1 isoform X2 n=1 Tax=Haplochromis burtoni TaxID=8153 RepID=UPI0006C975A9|nr:butyrophilin subfamily 1 member A1 isoform X2 [Haplochromis burtoni]
MELLSLLFMSSCFLTLSGLTFGTSVTVKEGDDAILPCSLSTNENIQDVRFDWTKEGTEKKVYIHDTGVDRSPALRGRVSRFPDDLKNGNASIRINKVQQEDGGIYTCDFPTRRKTFRIKLVVVDSVLKVRNVPGAAEPHVTSHDQINGGVLLQCDVQSGLPKPTVEWQDSNDQIIPSEELQVSEQGGRFHITLKATVEKSGRYHCVTTQEEIKHQAQKEINVHVNEPNTGLIVAVAGVAVGFAVVLAVVILLRRYIKNKKKTNKKESSEPSAQELKPNGEQMTSETAACDIT